MAKFVTTFLGKGRIQSTTDEIWTRRPDIWAQYSSLPHGFSSYQCHYWLEIAGSSRAKCTGAPEGHHPCRVRYRIPSLSSLGEAGAGGHCVQLQLPGGRASLRSQWGLQGQQLRGQGQKHREIRELSPRGYKTHKNTFTYNNNTMLLPDAAGHQPIPSSMDSES